MKKININTNVLQLLIPILLSASIASFSASEDYRIKAIGEVNKSLLQTQTNLRELTVEKMFMDKYLIINDSINNRGSERNTIFAKVVGNKKITIEDQNIIRGNILEVAQEIGIIRTFSSQTMPRYMQSKALVNFLSAEGKFWKMLQQGKIQQQVFEDYHLHFHSWQTETDLISKLRDVDTDSTESKAMVNEMLDKRYRKLASLQQFFGGLFAVGFISSIVLLFVVPSTKS